ncbi:MAG: protein kinase, partial [candidate division Zixibacteria bacterium]|nr:protein kinase [candidate division Zixibacteria bacterium]
MIGQTIAHYRVLEKLGSGGMGEVFLAEDTKLDRKVALKFLPEHLALEGEVKARFLQEAKAAAAFTHPNVCSIHDVQEHDGRMFIVMEYVDGPTLRDKKDSLSITQIVEIGAQIADGLAAAHQQGIVHRDIKSENIMLRKDGIAQLTDFGLAKLKGVTSRLTKEGSTLGTTGYMSPEQALGQDVDHRSDIFSLGVVLYELLTGEMPFTGAHEAAIMYEIVNVEAAPPSAVNPELDPELDRILLECLQKEPDERYQSAREVAKDLRRFKRDSGRKRVSRISQSRVTQSRAPATRMATSPHSVVGTPEPEPSEKKQLRWLPWALVAVLLLAVGYLLVAGARGKRTEGVYRFPILPPDNFSLTIEGAGNLAISPNGRYIVYAAQDSAQTPYLWLRPVDKLTAQQLPGTELGWYPFWSPDSRYVGFMTRAGKLKKIDVTGGPPVVLCDAASGRGGSWNENGDIIFSENSVSGIWRVSSAGGVPEPITVLDSVGERYTHRWPWFLPDGNTFLYYQRRGTGGSEGLDDSVFVG